MFYHIDVRRLLLTHNTLDPISERASQHDDRPKEWMDERQKERQKDRKKEERNEVIK